MTADPPEKVEWHGRYIIARRRGQWEYVGRARNIAAAVVVAISDGHLLLVEQWRVPLQRRVIELPAGLIGDDSPGEGVLDSAARELEEETGWRAGRLEIVGEFASSPGMVSETFHLVRAHDLTHVGPGGGVDGEDIVTHRVPITGFQAFLAARQAAGCLIDKSLALVAAGFTLR